MDNQVRKFKAPVFLSVSPDVIPEYKEVKIAGRKYVNHGANNLYPEYLLRLYKSSPKHGAIIKNKVKYIIGKGFSYNDATKTSQPGDILKVANTYGESLTKVAKKCAEDSEIYGGFYLQVIRKKNGDLSSLVHLEYNKMRSDEDNAIFFYKKDWRKSGGEIKEYPAFDPAKPEAISVFFHKEYSAGTDTYTNPEYAQANTYIEADILVCKHIFNNARSGFTASKSITFVNGEPETEQEKDEIEQAIKVKYSGESGTKVLISWVDNKESAPIIADLGASDLTKEDFTVIENIISQNIYASHSITSPALFGQKTEGQLGQSTELRNAYDIFRATYANSKAEGIEESFNYILTAFKKDEVKLVSAPPIGYDLSEIKGIAPEAYILKEVLGINPEEYPADVKPTPPPALPPTPPAKEDPTAAEVQAADQAKDEELLSVFAEYGIDKGEGLSIQKKVLKFSEEDLDSSAFIALADFTDAERQIIEILRKDPRATPTVLGDAVNMTEKAVIKVLDSMVERGLIEVSSERVGTDKQPVRKVTEEGKAAIKDRKAIKTSIKIMYSYDGPEDDRNRPFCARLMKLNRYYTRTEIEAISQRVGYSVWERRGGFYTNPETKVTTPYCRHNWAQEIVLTKKKES
jgi:DNA-binding MarR family transcriptional regulator